jgi:hypothetical protein
MEGNLKGPQLEDEEEMPQWKQTTRIDPVISKHHERTHSTHLTFRRPRYSQKLCQEHISGRHGVAHGGSNRYRCHGEESRRRTKPMYASVIRSDHRVSTRSRCAGGSGQRRHWSIVLHHATTVLSLQRLPTWCFAQIRREEGRIRP